MLLFGHSISSYKLVPTEKNSISLAGTEKVFWTIWELWQVCASELSQTQGCLHSTFKTIKREKNTLPISIYINRNYNKSSGLAIIFLSKKEQVQLVCKEWLYCGFILVNKFVNQPVPCNPDGNLNRQGCCAFHRHRFKAWSTSLLGGKAESWDCSVWSGEESESG